MVSIKETTTFTENSDPFAKYGIKFTESGSINGPKRPSLYSQTPELKLDKSDNELLTEERDFLEKCMRGPFSIELEKEHLMNVIRKIFTNVTGGQLNEYVNIIFMDKKEWSLFQEKKQGNVDRDKKYDAINLGGLVIVGAEGASPIIPLLFHETGHSLYPPTDNFEDEFRAYYFQLLCVASLEKQLSIMGLNYTYPEYTNDMFPSKDHREAYQSARALLSYESTHQDVDSSKYSLRMQQLSKILRKT